MSQVLRLALQQEGDHEKLVQELATRAVPELLRALLERLPFNDTHLREKLQGVFKSAIEKAAAAITKLDAQTGVGDMILACLDSDGKHAGALFSFAWVLVRTVVLSRAQLIQEDVGKEVVKKLPSTSTTLIQSLLRATLEYGLQETMAVPIDDVQNLVSALHLEKLSAAHFEAAAASRGSVSSQFLAFATVLLSHCSTEELKKAFTQSTVKEVLATTIRPHIPKALAGGSTTEFLVNSCVGLLVGELESLCGGASSHVTPPRDAMLTEPAIITLATAKPHALPAIMFDLVLRAAKQGSREKATEMKDVLVRMIRHKLVEYGAKDEDVDQAIEELEALLDGDKLLAALYDPPKLASSFFAAKFHGGGGDAALRCAKSMTLHWISERLQQRSFDARVVWIVREVLTMMPDEEIAAELVRSPEALLNKVLKQAVDRGQELAQELLEDGLTRAREEAARKLEALGMPHEQAQFLAEQAQDYLMAGADGLKDLAEGNGEGAAVSTEGVVLKLKEEIASVSAASALAFMGFFLRHRFLPIFDLISDIVVAAGLCTNDAQLVASIDGFVRGECTFNGDTGEVRRVFFSLTIIFILASWVVLWLALGMHVLKTPADNSIYTEIYEYLYEQYDFKIYEDLGFLLFTLFVRAVLSDWLGASSWSESHQTASFIAFLLCMLPMIVVVELPGVLLGMLATRSIRCVSGLLTRCGCSKSMRDSENFEKSLFRLGYTAWFMLCTIATLPIGVPLLILVEVLTLIFFPHQPTPGAFSSAYENLRRVLEPALESAPQAIIQLGYLVYTTAGRGKPFDDYTLLASLLASVGQLYQTFYYLRDTAQAYHQSMVSVVVELASLTSIDKVPFRLVLRSWPSVDYRSVPDNLGIDMFKQVGEALAGNEKLRCLRFAKRQVSGNELALLSGALAQSHVRELAILDDWAQLKERLKKLEGDTLALIGVDDKRRLLLGDQNERAIPEVFIHDVLGVTSSLRILRLEGFQLEPRQWSVMLSALGTGRSIEQLHLAGPRNEIDIKAKEFQVKELPSTHALVTLRSLKHLTLHHVPQSVLDALFRAGLQQSRSIVRLDLSHNTLGQDAARGIETWLRRPQLKTVLLDGISFVADSEDGAARAAIRPALALLKALCDPRASVQVFLITLASKEPVEKASSQAMKRLSGQAKLVLSRAPSARLVAIGICDVEGQVLVEAPSRLRQMWDHARGTARTITNALVPCLKLHETNVDTMLASLVRRQHDQSDPMADVCAAVVALALSETTCIALLLQQLPRELTTDMGRILARHVFDAKDGVKKSGLDKLIVSPKGPEVKESDVHLAVHGCRQTDEDFQLCFPLYVSSMVTHLTLRDNLVTELGLHMLEKEVFSRRGTTKLRRFELKASTILPAKMLVGLAHLAKQLKDGCGGPRGFAFPGFTGDREKKLQKPRSRPPFGFGSWPSHQVLDGAVASVQRGEALRMEEEKKGLLGTSPESLDALGILLIGVVGAADLSDQGITGDNARTLLIGIGASGALTNIE